MSYHRLSDSSRLYQLLGLAGLHLLARHMSQRAAATDSTAIMPVPPHTTIALPTHGAALLPGSLSTPPGTSATGDLAAMFAPTATQNGAHAPGASSEPDTEREVMSADETAEFLGLDRKSVYDAAGRGEIPHRRLGKRLLFSRSAVVRWLSDAGPRRT